MNFIPGLELNQKYYSEIVCPLLKQFDPNIRYSAGLIGYGSDVLGYDNETSMDHNWGPRLQIFLNSDDIHRKEEISEFFCVNLPPSFLGFPTNYSDPMVDGVRKMAAARENRVNHLIEIFEVESFFHDKVPKQITELTNRDWLSIPEQVLLELTTGTVFHDELGRVNELRQALKYYPNEVKKIKLATLWNCIANEEAFVGRAVENGDLIGLKLIASRIVNYLLKICFVLKERYIPYSKWFSIVFQSLKLPQIEEEAKSILQENDPKKIEEKTAKLYRAVLNIQNGDKDLPTADNKITTYYTRPYLVIKANEIVETMIQSLKDRELKELELSWLCIDNKIDSEDFTDSEKPLI